MSAFPPGFDPTCYCDPSVVMFHDCSEAGCRAYAGFFFVLFLLAFVEGCRRVWVQRALWRKASFISNMQLTLGSMVFMIRHILLIAKVREIYTMAVGLGIGMSLLYSAYLWVLISWCDIIISVNFSKVIQRILPVIRWIIVALNVIVFFVTIYDIVIFGPFWVLNLSAAFYGFGTSIGFFALGLIIWREYKQVSQIAAHGTLARNTYKKVKSVARLAVVVVIAAILMTVVSVAATFWVAKSDGETVAWLFINRIAIVFFNYAMLICWIPHKLTIEGSNSSKNSGQQSAWSAKMKEMEFQTKEVEDDDSDDLEAEASSPTNSTNPPLSTGDVEIGVSNSGGIPSN
eukprot:gene12789-15005_t